MNIDEQTEKAFTQLGKHIQILRENKNITLDELSKTTGIRKNYLKKIEDGLAYGVLVEKHLLKIARTLKISMQELFDFDVSLHIF